MKRTTRHRSITPYKDESRLFYASLMFCFLVFVGYMYFVSASVIDVVMRKEVDTEIAQLGSRISQLEASYIEKQHAVSEEIASLQGFVQADKKVFIDKSAATLVLSGN